MSLLYHNLKEHIAILTLNDNDNKFNTNFVLAFLKQLDYIEKNTNAKTLIIRSSHNNIFSNGIDIEWLLPIIHKKNTSKIKEFLYILNRLLKRIITYPLITIASINGHAFGAGAIMCCAFDFRFMRSDKGFLCLPEIDLGIPFLPGMNAIIKKTLPRHILNYMVYTGAKLTAIECEKNNIITKACNNDSLFQETINFAKTIKKNKNTTKEIKKRLNASIIKNIEIDDIKYIESGILYIK